MLKKILSIIIAASTAISVHAKEDVAIVWWAGLATGPVNYARVIIDEANKSQDKYNFYLEPKPGAGGAIAAQYTLTANKLAIMGTGDAFFVRPNLYPEEKLYKVDDFQLMLPQFSIPYAVAVNKNKPISVLEKQPQITIGVGGLGTQQHLIAEQLKLKHPNMVIVPLKTHSDVIQQLIGGHLDMGTEFVASISQYPQLEIYGVTGPLKIDNNKTLNSLGYKGLDKYNINVYMVAPRSMPESTFNEINKILVAAQTNNEKIIELLKRDKAQAMNLKRSDYDQWYKNANNEAKQKTKGIKIE